jgi:hypothetical protein
LCGAEAKHSKGAEATDRAIHDDVRGCSSTEESSVSIEHEEEEVRETQRHFTGDEELRRPTMAGGRKFLATACTREERMQGMHGRGKGVREDSSSGFIGQGREREWRPGPIGH